MNLLKLMTVGCLLSCFSGLMTSCSDDDDAGSKVLLRPVTAMEIVQNKAYLSWKSVEGATEISSRCIRWWIKGKNFIRRRPCRVTVLPV